MKIKKVNEMFDLGVPEKDQKLILRAFISVDWEAIYLDGEILDQGHSLRVDEVLIKLIKKGVDLTDYKYGSIVYEKDGKNFWIDEDSYDSTGWNNAPLSLDEMSEGLSKIGATMKIDRLEP